MPDAIAKLKSMAQEISNSSSLIQSPDFSNRKLADESAPWVEDYKRGGEILKLLAENLAGKGDGDYVQQLADEVLKWRSRIFGSSLHMFLIELADDLNSVEYR
jgi:hypothetical protein